MSPSFPIGLRSWNNQHLQEIQSEGFECSLLEDCSNAYRFTAIAGTDKIADLVTSFSGFLGEESFFILEFYPEAVVLTRNSKSAERPEPTIYYSPYLPTDYIITTLAPYFERLIHDGFVGFGIANNRKGLELFYSEEKVLTFFTDNHLRLCTFLQTMAIPHSNRLVLPQDFAHDHLSLLGIPNFLLPAKLKTLSKEELNSSRYCQEIVSALDMYEVEEGLSFFLTRKEQDDIAELISYNLPEHEFSDAEFGGLLLDWSDFVNECETSFGGDLWEYRQGLKIRDIIQLVIDVAPADLAEKIKLIITTADEQFRQILTDRRKPIDLPAEHQHSLPAERFWYQGVIRNQGYDLRRDLIRSGWYKG